MPEAAVLGQAARMMNTLGQKLAAATRTLQAPNQRETDLLPPEMIAHPAKDGATWPDGNPRMSYGDRFQGGNSIQLRLDAEARGSSDTRYGTQKRVEWVNRAHKQPQAPIRGMNPVTKQLPQPVTVVSINATPVQTVHQKDGQGFGSQGEKGGLIDVKKGKPIYDEKGQQAADFHEKRDVYKAYHVTDLNVAGIKPRTAPNEGRSAVVRQDAAFAKVCTDRGEEPRKPDKDERTTLVVTSEIAKITADQRNIKGVSVVEDVPGIKEAQFVVKDGKPTVEIPPAAEFSDLHHQATSVVQAVSHSQLHSAAVADVGRATEAGRVDQAAVDRVAAYEAPVETRAGSEEFSKADLAATYATLNRTTAIPAVYVPPAQTQEPENVERWAKTMEAPGGMSKVSQDITGIEQGFSDDRKETLRIAKDLTREATQLKRAEARQGPVPGVPVPAAPAAPEPKPTRVGGDPELGAAPQRGGAGGAAATKTQTRTEDTPAKGKGKKKPDAPGDGTR